VTAWGETASGRLREWSLGAWRNPDRVSSRRGYGPKLDKASSAPSPARNTSRSDAGQVFALAQGFCQFFRPENFLDRPRFAGRVDFRQ
jgi:hypothetical protein